MYEYKALITRVVDGDTFDAIVDVGFSIKVTHRFRLANIDTPETWRPKTEAEYQHGLKATTFVKDLIEGKTVTLRTYKLDIYNRYSADLILKNGDLLSEELKDFGFEKLESYE